MDAVIAAVVAAIIAAVVAVVVERPALQSEDMGAPLARLFQEL